MTEFGLGGPWPPKYPSGGTVRSSVQFQNYLGQPADPTTVTAQVQFGPTNIVPFQSLSVIRDSVGNYHTEVVGQWQGPGAQLVTVTWTGAGSIAETFVDTFQLVPGPGTVGNIQGP